jgi:hypothetical protein
MRAAIAIHGLDRGARHIYSLTPGGGGGLFVATSVNDHDQARRILPIA